MPQPIAAKPECAAAQLEVLQGVLEYVPLGLVVADAEGKVILVNAATEAIFSAKRQALLGKPVTELIPKGFRESLHACQAAAGKWTAPSAAATELVGRRQDGAELPLEVALATLQTRNGVLGIAYLRDVSEQHQFEERSRSSNKLEAIGRLAGGVAHDFNNLLTAILGYSEILLRKLRPDGPMWEELQQIRRAGDRAAGLTRQLLAFSRRQVLAPVVIDLNAQIKGLEDLLRRLIREDIQLVLDLDRQLMPVKADPAQLEQVIVNLVVNARDAMPSGGQLTVRTCNVPPSKLPAGTATEIRLGSFARMSVSDTGCGMDAQTMSRIFEPFFTTKEIGKGTGLGLATVYGIVKQSGGQIEVESQVGKGSTFHVFLPQAVGVPVAIPQPMSVAETPRGAETILIAEDEEAVRLLAGRVLETSGYRVLQARHGVEALEIALQFKDTIHLLVTDVVMPKMNGRDLVLKLSPTRPQMRIMYMSGYTDTIIAFHKILESGAAFLQKPFTPEALVKTVREVLDQSAPAAAK